MNGRCLTLPLIPLIDPTYETTDPNPYQVVKGVVEIRLINIDRPTTISTEDLPLCRRYHWYAEWQSALNTYYAVADVKLRNGD